MLVKTKWPCDTVKIHEVMVYPLLSNLKEWIEVRVISRHIGYSIVERDWKQHRIHGPCINPGFKRTR